MTSRIFRRALAGALLPALVAAAGVSAQQLQAGTGAYLETYSFSEAGAVGLKRVSLLTVPIVAEFQPVRWARLGVSSAYASGVAVRSDDSESTISGLTDTALQLTLPLVRDRFAITGTVVLPTGKSTYTPDEAQVAGVIAADLLPFRLTNWGSGGSIDLSSQVAGSFGGLNVGARVGYQMGQEFDLLEDGSFSYRPGNQVYVRLAADGSIGDARAAAQVTLHTFGDDQLNDQNLYRSGKRLQGLFSYSTPAGRTGRLQLYLGALRREHGTFLDGSDETPAQTLLLIGSGLRRPLGRAVFVPSIDFRLLRNSDGLGQGYVGGAGLSLELPIAGGAVTLLPAARARFGTLLVSRDVESGITGFDVGTGIRFGGAR